ncbi:MAG: hypothetical protein FWG23_06945 [Eggerthellaceae bacterium]|jgi:predicted nucleic acid-binding Zn ribbon protein|nr:hypothetical protein [Eggerthellaceae bacterium]MDR2715794.1 hypothetical protein [Coriobacteriaceae bacterium]
MSTEVDKDRRDCPKCGAANPPAAMVCTECSELLPKVRSTKRKRPAPPKLTGGAQDLGSG